MIEHIAIRNFQAHQRLDIDLDHGVNVIVGPTDVGKSAIVRALRWLVFNEPAGDAFRSWWGGRTVVIVDTEEGHTVKRVRTDKSNYYEVDSEKYKAFGRGVPEQVSAVLNLAPLNFLYQGDPAFLLSKSPSQVAKELNSIANLDVIDRAISNVGAHIRQTQSDIRSTSAHIDMLKGDLAQYDDLDELETAVERAEQKAKRLAAVQRQAAAIKNAAEHVRKCKEQLDTEKGRFPTTLVKQVDAALQLIDRCNDTKSKKAVLKSFIDRIQRLDEDIADLKSDLAEAEQEFRTKLEGAPCPLCGRTA